jgi:uncharacterized RDD family membrane protein YckC
VSEIPVGSPPVPPGRHAAPSGWYPDPVNGANERYWDGWQWSRNTRPNEGSVPPPKAPGPGGQPQHPAQPYGQGPQQNPYGQGPQQNPYGKGAQPNLYGQGAQPYAYAAKPVPMTEDGVPLAGWWWRALAVVIDAVIVGVFTSLLLLPIYLRLATTLGDYFRDSLAAAQQGQPMPPQPDLTALLSGSDQLILLLVSLAVHTLYLTMFVHWRSATPGKLVVGLRVVPVDRGRSTERLGWSTCFVRALIWTVPNVQAVLFVIRIVDVLMPLWNPKRQALHDVAAKTQVVKIR